MTPRPSRSPRRYGEQAAGRVGVRSGDASTYRPPSWVDALTAARDELGLTFFDWLTAVDQTDAADEPGFDVVCHLWSVDRHEHLFAAHPGAGGRVARLGDRRLRRRGLARARDLRDVRHRRSPATRTSIPLLLPDGFEGHPLRKDFVLAARAAKAWPGAKEPGESDDGGAAEPPQDPATRRARPATCGARARPAAGERS